MSRPLSRSLLVMCVAVMSVIMARNVADLSVADSTAELGEIMRQSPSNSANATNETEASEGSDTSSNKQLNTLERSLDAQPTDPPSPSPTAEPTADPDATKPPSPAASSAQDETTQSASDPALSYLFGESMTSSGAAREGQENATSLGPELESKFTDALAADKVREKKGHELKGKADEKLGKAQRREMMRLSTPRRPQDVTIDDGKPDGGH